MEQNNILNADILDIIFDGRNKNYGAYELRKTYSKRLTRSLIGTGLLLLTIFLGSVFANIIEKYSSKEKIDVVDTELANAKNVVRPLLY